MLMNKKIQVFVFCCIFAVENFVPVAIAQTLKPASRQAEYTANAKQRKELIRDYGLTEDQAQKIQQFSWERSQQITTLNNQNLSEQELRVKRDVVTDKYDQKINNILTLEQRNKLKALLGEEKFVQWLNFKNSTLERKYKTKYGVTTKQFNKYKAIENKMAIDILTIKKSAIPIAAKTEKNLIVKNAYIESMRLLLSPTQFEKWHTDYLKAEQKHNNPKQFIISRLKYS